MSLLRTIDVVKQYAAHRALDQVSLEVPKGSVYGLLGPNGAGKTTLIRIINRITVQDSGSVLLDGHEISREDTLQIGYLPEERGLYKKMKVGEQAVYLAQLKGMEKRAATAELVKWFRKFEIEDWWNRKVEELSKGMQQKVQFIVTVIHKPKLLIFDEPFSGFDPINTNLLKEEILNLRDNGSTIIFSTHNMASVEEICDHIALIDRSRKILEGKVSDIKRSFNANRYEIVMEASNEPSLNASASGLDLIQSQHRDGVIEMLVQASNGMRPNDVFARLSPFGQIRSFTEHTPTMNEIFIDAVQNNKNHHA
jgi:ABC-2 type transport system ATP-binding protein